ncbi:MAG TPA: patatin-like phospholipase family protein [Anaeromyxobacteraceae bacterium]|nr:patatin-like phospholipase family protein [Anaeromyxobacteraceae bacterium]
MLPPDDQVDAWKARTGPLEEAEVALVRAVVSQPAWLPEHEEHALRYALNLARLGPVRVPGGGDVDLAPLLAPYREEVLSVVPPLLARSGVDQVAAARLAPHLAAHARAWRARALAAFEGRLPPEALDRECCEKALVLVCGGGGGVAWSYLGAFDLLEQYGLTPRLLAGTSMGAAIGLFRARHARWRAEEVAEVVRGLSFRTLFRFLETGSRYGLPAAMRLCLRAAVSGHLAGPGGQVPALRDLAIPLVVTCTGLRTGALPRDPEYYEHLLAPPGPGAKPHAVKRLAGDVFRAVGELMAQRDRFARVYLGADEGTEAFDAVDAVGFSSALPGVIHYDVLRDDPAMHALLGELFARRDLSRLVDGGLVDNLPARTAWGMAQAGALGTRNAFVLGLEGFGPKLTQPLWFGLEQLAAQNVARSRPFVHLLKSYQRVLSPVEVVPGERTLARAIQSGKAELLPDMPLVARLCRPYPALR